MPPVCPPSFVVVPLKGWGWFNAYDAATRYDLDAWIHLGDILYEYGVDQVGHCKGAAMGKALSRPQAEISP